MHDISFELFEYLTILNSNSFCWFPHDAPIFSLMFWIERYKLVQELCFYYPFDAIEK